MGIRISTMLGYSLPDLVHEDPRVNWDSPLFNHSYLWSNKALHEYLEYIENSDAVMLSLERLVKKNVDEYEKLLETFNSIDNKLLHRHLKNPYNDYSLNKSVVHHCDPDAPKEYLIVKPVSANDWHRGEDIIDLWNHHQNYGLYEVREEFLPDGIFPYSGIYMNADSGEEIPYHDGIQWQIMYDALWDNPDGDHDQEAADAVLNEYAQNIGFGDAQEAGEKLVPYIPEPVKALINFGDIFTSEDIWKELRPVLFTYWG